MAGATLSIAEAQSLVECVGRLRIMQPVCANGHLPARFTGPTTFVFMGSDQQCPVCRSRVADPEHNEFNLIWPEERLGHEAEKEVDGGDGRLVPTTARGILAAIGTLHLCWQTPVDGERPAIEEIAMTLMHGYAIGIEKIPNGTDVLNALRDPSTACLDAWRCESVLRAARGAWRRARNPFVQKEVMTRLSSGPPRNGPYNFSPTKTWTGSPDRVIRDVIESLCSDVTKLINAASRDSYTAAYIVRDINLHDGIGAVTEELCRGWHRHGVDHERDLYVELCKAFPGRAGDIAFAASKFGVVITATDLD